MFAFFPSGFDEFVEFCIAFDVFIILFFLIDIYDVSILFIFLPLNEIFQNITLAGASGTDQNNDISFANPRIEFAGIVGSRDNFHNV